MNKRSLISLENLKIMHLHVIPAYSQFLDMFNEAVHYLVCSQNVFVHADLSETVCLNKGPNNKSAIP